jgi:DNA-directed RNA polymerase specialized sigma24 family protein
MRPFVDDPGIDLMAAHLDGPDGAEQFVERHAERVYRLALRIAGVKDDAEEVVE